ncbi:hypothetical protein QYE76_064356 [Lolium multiflorum]|uniref:Uncharacterized protein n=1 Tax=Lolium multiflorum TaxID=4521 RepID=A0AAD8S6A6_LOLMU|nr:hypothetical protein QYE76_064356 [Lolium multiflorum]
MEKMMAENQAAMAKGTRRGIWKKRPQLSSTSTSPKRSLRSKGWTSRPKRQTPIPNCVTPRLGGWTPKTRAEDTRIMLADLSSMDDDTGAWFMKKRANV